MSMMRRVASRMMDLGAALLPAAQDEWMRAMRAEAAHVDEGAALGFAAGCLLACFRERLRLAADVAPAVRHALVAALLLYAVFAARSGLRLAHAEPSTARVVGGIAALYAVAALGGMWRGGVLVRAGMALLPLSLGAATWLAVISRDRSTGSAIDASLTSGLAIEGAFIWLAVLSTCLLGTRDRSRKRSSTSA